MSAGELLAKGARARRLQLDVALRVDGALQGEHRAASQGSGGDLAEARLYAPGDDVRRLDWAVLARTGTPYVRTQNAERELETTFVVDLTPSMTYGSRVQSKRTLALTMVAAFSHLLAGPGDRIGAVVLHRSGLTRIRSRGAATAPALLLNALEKLDAGEGAAPTLAEALRLVPRARGMVVVISDLLGHRDWETPLRRVTAGHDTIVVQLQDPHERELADVGLLRLVDPESGRSVDVSTGDRAVRTRYRSAALARQEAVTAAVRGCGAGHLLLSTDADWLPELSRFLGRRRRVRTARGT